LASDEFTNLIALVFANRVTPADTVDEIRSGVQGLGALLPVMAGTDTADVDVDGVAGRWYSAEGGALDDDGASPVVLHFHGGGYVMSNLDTHGALCSRLARASGGRVLSIDYRLAPEHPFPAAVDDAVGAYRWLLDQGISSHRIVIAGDSAGGGLALHLLAHARDTGIDRPAGAVLMSPWVDLTGSGASVLAHAAIDPVLSPELMQHWGTLYAGDDLADPAASPLFADLGDLPPVMVQVGSREILYDDALRTVERIVAAGGKATLAVWDEMTHWWQLFAGLVPEADAALDELGAFVHRVTSARPAPAWGTTDTD
jgi:monoterpene epsilon-lactone hydrolase